MNQPTTWPMDPIQPREPLDLACRCVASVAHLWLQQHLVGEEGEDFDSIILPMLLQT